MKDEIRQAIAEMVARGVEPAAIVMTPPELKRFQRECSPQDGMFFHHQGSGWTFEGLPIWRSWHMSGPSVVAQYLLRLLQREGYSVMEPVRGTNSMTTRHEPYLF